MNHPHPNHTKGDSPQKRGQSPFVNKGVTLLELILVLVIIAIGGALAYPRLQQGMENRKAKQALETMKNIAQAVRLYEVDQGNPAANIAALEPFDSVNNPNGKGYLNPNQYEQSFTYSINTTASPPTVTAIRSSPSRTLTLQVFCQVGPTIIRGRDGTVTDTVGFLTKSSC